MGFRSPVCLHPVPIEDVLPCIYGPSRHDDLADGIRLYTQSPGRCFLQFRTGQFLPDLLRYFKFFHDSFTFTPEGE